MKMHQADRASGVGHAARGDREFLLRGEAMEMSGRDRLTDQQEDRGNSCDLASERCVAKAELGHHGCDARGA